MTGKMTRRDFVATGAVAAAGAMASPSLFAEQGDRTKRAADIAVGITSNTRPEWNGARGFVRSIDECSEIGYRMIETFFADVRRWEHDRHALRDEMDRRNLGFITISNSGGMQTNFTDPALRDQVVADHMNLVDFIEFFGCEHLKINIGGHQPPGNTQTPEIYRAMATTMNEIGRRMADRGMKFGVHAHLNSAFETREDIDAIMELTDPRWVYFILDTGHITMAGMDPVQLTRDYTDRIIEYHLKDTHWEDRGGTTRLLGRRTPPRPQGQPEPAPEYPGIDRDDLPASIQFRDRYFYELGKGGVDFPAIKQVLDDANWTGWFAVELDSTVTTAKGSATVSKQYLERILGLDVETPGQRPNWDR